MNWKKALLITVLGLFALVFFVVAATGLLATAAIGAAAVAISESGVVQAFEEVADGADRLQIDIDDNALTITNPDTGESRAVIAGGQTGRGRVDFNLPEITVTDTDVQSRVIVPGLRGVGQVTMPEITITDPDSGQSRVIRPNVERFENAPRVPRVVWDGDFDWRGFNLDRHDYVYGPETGLRIVGGFFRGLFNLTALVLIAAGAYLLLRNRRRAQAKLDQAGIDPVDIDKTAQ